MFKDSDMTWEGEFPYDVLAPAGVTSQSSMSEVLDAMHHFTQQEQVEKAQNAWSALRKVKSRLFIDFFLYRTAPPGVDGGVSG